MYSPVSLGKPPPFHCAGGLSGTVGGWPVGVLRFGNVTLMTYMVCGFALLGGGESVLFVLEVEAQDTFLRSAREAESSQLGCWQPSAGMLAAWPALQP